LRRRPGPRPAAVRESPLPAPSDQRGQDPQTDLLPVRILRPAARPGQPYLLRPQTLRGKATPSGTHRPGTPSHQRVARHPAHPAPLRNRSCRCGLTFALGCLASALAPHLPPHEVLRCSARELAEAAPLRATSPPGPRIGPGGLAMLARCRLGHAPKL